MIKKGKFPFGGKFHGFAADGIAESNCFGNQSERLLEIIGLFWQLNQEQRLTVILVTHDQDVARHARRTIVLRDGQVVADTSDFSQAIAALHVSPV